MKYYVICKIEGEKFLYLTANRAFTENKNLAYVFEGYDFCKRVIDNQLGDGTYEIYEI